ncbi:hypothetical protein CC86DRAFT_204191 [Ophiobolus disseminans]|uniref:Uncharacterized protein n=1 Tax=Ophiobolus disseminans TaxID=1469910 RepID=A0A6A7A5I1_9PLEO|nr:hypothetical protein CC86DRAFT_204191 [Ophiobolus disseminans]
MPSANSHVWANRALSRDCGESLLQGVLPSAQEQVDYSLGKGHVLRSKWKRSKEHNPHGSYTGAMSYEHEPAGPVCESLHCCSSRKLLSPSLLVLPVWLSVAAATQNPLLRRSWRHCYLCGRYRALAVVDPLLTSGDLGSEHKSLCALARLSPKSCLQPVDPLA